MNYLLFPILTSYLINFSYQLNNYMKNNSLLLLLLILSNLKYLEVKEM